MASAVSSRTSPSTPAAPREPRTLVVFFERMQLPNFSAEPITRKIKDVIHETIAPGDSVSLVIWSRYGKTEHVEFTGDLGEIDAELDKLGQELQHAQLNDTPSLREEMLRSKDFQRQASTNPVATASATTALMLPMLMAYGEMKMRVNAINSTIATMAGIEGKKVMIVATRRLGEVAGAEYAFVSGLAFIPYELRQRFGTAQLFKSMTDMANASGVTIYPIYPLGVGTAMADAGMSTAPSEVAESLTYQNELIGQNQVAQRTGGLAAGNTHDILELLPRVADDITDYYSLAYRVTPTGKDTARQVVVKTKNPELRVRSRREFVEKSDETRMRDRLRATFFRAGQEQPQIDIDAKIGARKKRGQSTVPLEVRIPIADLTTLPQGGGKHAGSFSVYVASAADLDELSDITRKTQPFELKESQLEAARKGYFTYDVDLTLNAKAKYVAVGVVDEVGRTFGMKRLSLENLK